MEWESSWQSPFDFSELWRASAFSTDPIASTSIFRPVQVDLPTLQLQDGGTLIKHDAVFKLPDLGAPGESWPLELEDVDGGETSASDDFSLPAVEEHDEQLDIWDFDVHSVDVSAVPRLCTWVAFNGKVTTSSEQPTYLSEAGPGVFDALLQQRDRTAGVLPQDTAARALCSLALGRSSLFFHWDTTSNCFTQTLEKVPISGLSIMCSSSLIEGFIECGSTFRQLSDYAACVETGIECAALVAFKRCICDILDLIEDHGARYFSGAHSVLQLQAMSERAFGLIRTLAGLRSALQDSISEEDMISQLCDSVQYLAESDSPSIGILRTILTRVIAPWLERLAEDLGLAATSGDAWRTMSPGTREEAIDLDLSSAGRSKLLGHFPAFVVPEDSALISDTINGLELLRQHLPETPMTSPASHGIMSGFRGMLDGSVDIEAIFESAKAYEWQVKEALKKHQHVLASPLVPLQADHNRQASADETKTLLDELYQTDDIAELDAVMASIPSVVHPRADSELGIATVSLLNDEGISRGPAHLDLSSSGNIGPVDRMRPLIEAQYRLVNGTLLRHLFRTCKLREHLALQHAFHLLGNGSFVARLSTALFSAETQSAERKRVVFDTGETMGLRVDAREGQRWPPASSELRLTLMGILNEAYHGKSGDRSSLQGGMSFAIRELPEAEIEKVLDVSSIYALDFLRLQYEAPAPLDAILTSSSLQKYDDIFRFLLRLLRVLHVTTVLIRRHSDRREKQQNRGTYSDKQQAALRFALKANHVITTLMSHAMDVCIGAPWHGLTALMSNIESALSVEDAQGGIGTKTSIGVEGLRQIHESCLESIRGGLFLRRKHEKIRAAVEDLLTAVMGGAKDMNADVEQNDLRQKTTNLDDAVSRLLELLRDWAMKPQKAAKVKANGESESDTVKLLLGRLNWNWSLDDG